MQVFSPAQLPLQVTGCGLRAAGYGLRAGGCGLRVAGCRLLTDMVQDKLASITFLFPSSPRVRIHLESMPATLARVRCPGLLPVQGAAHLPFPYLCPLRLLFVRGRWCPPGCHCSQGRSLHSSILLQPAAVPEQPQVPARRPGCVPLSKSPIVPINAPFKANLGSVQIRSGPLQGAGGSVPGAAAGSCSVRISVVLVSRGPTSSPPVLPSPPMNRELQNGYRSTFTVLGSAFGHLCCTAAYSPYWGLPKAHVLYGSALCEFTGTTVTRVC